MDALPPIPTPTAQRWREFRIQTLPVVTFLAILACVVLLWRQYVLPTNIVGEVESFRAPVISAVPGTLTVKVKRFDRVKAGQEVAQVVTMTPELFQASLHAIEAELKLLRSRMQLDIVRNDQNYQTVRLQYLNERASLDLERVNNKYYEREVARQYTLLTNDPPLIALTVYEAAVRLAESTRVNILEKEKYLAEKEKTIPLLQDNTPADSVILEDIKAQEEKLRATELIVSLKAPIDGMVSLVEHFTGEKIVPNVPIVTISAVQASRIIGYVRKPFSEIPKPGDQVTIRKQTFKREVASGIVIEVSGQLEQITPTLIPPVAGAKIELGLPFAVSIPAELALIPGEPVDLIFKRR